VWSEEGIVLTVNAAAGATSLSISNGASIDWRGEAVLISACPSGTPAALTVEGIAIDHISGNTIYLAAPIQSHWRQPNK